MTNNYRNIFLNQLYTLISENNFPMCLKNSPCDEATKLASKLHLPLFFVLYLSYIHYCKKTDIQLTMKDTEEERYKQKS